MGEKRTRLVHARITPRAARVLDAVCFSDERSASYVINRALEKLADELADERSPAKAEEPRRAQPRRPR